MKKISVKDSQKASPIPDMAGLSLDWRDEQWLVLEEAALGGRAGGLVELLGAGGLVEFLGGGGWS